MLTTGLDALAGKRVLLLQGPVGPFFARFANVLRQQGVQQVFKVNFHAGDWLFFPRGGVIYRGTMQAWPQWLRKRLIEWRIDVVFLFGDMRPIHLAAHAVVQELGLELGVFEEGYVRPNYVTLERFGVNANSLLADSQHVVPKEVPPVSQVVNVGSTYWQMVWWGFGYFTVGGALHALFPHYRHHRKLTVLEALPWLRAVWRKHKYAWLERKVLPDLQRWHTGRFFLVPLQVYNDYQVTHHYAGASVKVFMREVVASFAVHAPANTCLVFKHHPMDRGYCDYRTDLQTLAREFGLGPRVRYIHDQHLPTLLDHARGVVVINSSVGLQALRHGVPTKVCGDAMYDKPGLTYQGSLDAFWQDAPRHPPDADLCQRYVRHLIHKTQINGSFYKALKHTQARAGLIWQ